VVKGEAELRGERDARVAEGLNVEIALVVSMGERDWNNVETGDGLVETLGECVVTADSEGVEVMDGL